MTETVTNPPASPAPGWAIIGVALFFVGGGFATGWFVHRNSVAKADELSKEEIVSGPATPVPTGPIFATPDTCTR